MWSRTVQGEERGLCPQGGGHPSAPGLDGALEIDPLNINPLNVPGEKTAAWMLL